MDPITLIGAAMAAITLGREVLAIIEKTQAEGRDMTDEELAVVQAGVDLKHNATVAALLEAAKNG